MSEVANNLKASAYADIVDLLSEGPIKGFTFSPFRSILLDDVVIENADGTRNHQGVEIEFRDGAAGQPPLTHANYVFSEASVNVEVRFGFPVVRSITNVETDGVRVSLQWPGLLASDDEGNVLEASCQFKVLVKNSAEGAVFEEALFRTIKGKTNTTWEIDFDIGLNKPGPWDVKVERLTPDDSTTKKTSRFLWARYTELLTERLNYEGSSVAGLRFEAKQFGSRIPARGYKLDGRILKVPSNYDPETRTYTGMWDGTFKDAWTNNHAWVLYDLLTHKRYGLGRFVAEEEVDKWALYEIAQYNDEMVSDFNGGEEPRFTFNGVLTDEEEVVSALAAVAGSCNVMIYWSAGLVTFAQDRPDEPVKLITSANVIDGAFTYSGSGVAARHTVVNVAYVDPVTGKEALVPVEDADSIVEFGYRETNIYAMGCTSRSQAIRTGRWVLESEKVQNDTITWKAAWDQVDLRPGDHVLIQDPSVADVRNGGRLKAVTSATEVVLDDAVTPTSGQTILILKPDGNIHSCAVSISDDGITATLAAAMDPVAAPGAMWIVEQPSVSARPGRILNIREIDRAIFEITALHHDPTKFDRIESNWDAELPGDYVETQSLPPPTGLQVIDYHYQEGGTWRSGLFFDWDRQEDARIYGYQFQWRTEDGVWFGSRDTDENWIDVRPARTDLVAFRVRALGFSLGQGAAGQTSPWVVQAIDLVDDAPPAITITETAKRGARRIEWTYAADGDLPAFASYVAFCDGAFVGRTDKGTLVLNTSALPLTGAHTVVVQVSAFTFGVYALTPPAAVANLEVEESFRYESRVQQIALALAWDAAAGAAYYEVWQRLSGGGWALVDYTNDTSWASEWRPAAIIGNVYDFAVVAVKADGARLAPEAGSSVTIEVAGDTEAPAAPSITITELLPGGGRRVELEVDPPADDLASFDVLLNGSMLAQPAWNAPTFDTAIIPLYGEQTLEARAVDLAGNASSYATYMLTPLANASNLAASRAVTFVNRQPIFAITLSWDAVASAEYYEVWWRCTDAATGFPWVLLDRPTGTSVVAAGLAAANVGKVFDFAVLPVKADGARPTVAAAAQLAYTLVGDTTLPPSPTVTVTEVTQRGLRRIAVALTAPADLDRFEYYVDGVVVGQSPWNVLYLDAAVALTGSHLVEVYAVDTSGNASLPGSVSITPPSNPASGSASESLTYPAGYAQSDAVLTWAASTGAAYYEIWRQAGVEYLLLGTTVGTTYTDVAVAYTRLGTAHSYRIVPVRANGGRVAPASGRTINLTAYGDVAPLAQVQDFVVEETAEFWRRFWWASATFEALPDLLGYQLRYTRGTFTQWGDALPLNEGYLARPPFELRATPEGASRVLIKAFDVNGNESTTAASITVDLGDRPIANIIDEFDFGPAWAGTITGGSVDGDDLVTVDLGDNIYQNGGAAQFYTDGASALVYTSSYDGLEYQDEFTITANAILTMTSDAEGPVYLYYKLASTSVWIQWTSPVNIVAGTYDVKILVAPSREFSTIHQFSVIIDLPDVVERLSDVAVADTGQRLVLTFPFTEIRAVGLTLQDTGGTGAVVATVVDRNPSLGPLIMCYDANGDPVAATVDATVQGY